MGKQKTTIYLSGDVRRAVAILRQRDSRSMSSMIEVLIRNEAIRQGVFVPTPLKAVTKKPSG